MSEIGAGCRIFVGSSIRNDWCQPETNVLGELGTTFKSSTKWNNILAAVVKHYKWWQREWDKQLHKPMIWWQRWDNASPIKHYIGGSSGMVHALIIIRPTLFIKIMINDICCHWQFADLKTLKKCFQTAPAILTAFKRNCSFLAATPSPAGRNCGRAFCTCYGTSFQAS